MPALLCFVCAEIKNQWARDDPAFLVLLLYLLTAGSTAYTICFGVHSTGHWLRVVLGSVALEFAAVGVVVASLYRWLANTHLRFERVMSNTDQRVEWLYAFDIHCNA